jgi:methylthioribulose-1-phosphate dehydratase
MSTRKAPGRKSHALLFRKLAVELAEIGGEFYARGWAFGTSGNLSAVVQADSLRLAVTASGIDKGRLTPLQILEIDAGGNVVVGKHKPSSEAAIHVAIVRGRAAGAVFHTHSTWGTILSETHAREKGAVNGL